MLYQDAEHFAASSFFILNQRIQFPIGKGSRSAFPELHVGIRQTGASSPEILHIPGSGLHILSPFQQDGAVSGPCQQISAAPRMDKDKGLISQYTFSVSDDGQNWKEVKKGQFTYHYIRKDPAVQRIDFGKPVEARYFKLDARSPVKGGEQSATVAELNIITQ